MHLEEIKMLIKTSYAALLGGEVDRDSAIGTLEMALNFWDKLDDGIEPIPLIPGLVVSIEENGKVEVS
jgi:hypothetical protein